MVRLCGRFGFDVDRMWDQTPGIFEELVAGGLEREKVHRFAHALTAAAVLNTMGNARTTPARLLGEEEDYGENPFGAATPEEKRAAHLKRLEAMAKKTHDEWMPEGIDDDLTEG